MKAAMETAMSKQVSGDSAMGTVEITEATARAGAERECPRCGSNRADRFAYELLPNGHYNGCRFTDDNDPWHVAHDKWHDTPVAQDGTHAEGVDSAMGTRLTGIAITTAASAGECSDEPQD